MYQSSPAYTIPQQPKRRLESHEEVPPPNKYILNSKFISRRCPAWKIGTAKRRFFTDLGEGQPGPFDYNNDKSIVLSTAPKYKIAEKIKTERSSYGPGPSSYEPFTQSVLRKSPRVKFPKQQRKIIEEKDGPGPADYNTPSEFGLTQKSVFGRAARFLSQDRNRLNSSSIYLPNTTFVQHHSPSYKFGTEQRRFTETTNGFTPAPNKYDIRLSSIFRKTEGGTFSRQKRKIQSQMAARRVPGPSDYNIKFHNDAPFHSIPKSPRNPMVNSARVPGPGQYDPHFEIMNQSSPRPIFPKSKRSIRAATPSPDPFTYSLKPQTPKGISFPKQRRNDEQKNITPAPNAYNIPSSVSVIPSYERTHRRTVM